MPPIPPEAAISSTVEPLGTRVATKAAAGRRATSTRDQMSAVPSTAATTKAAITIPTGLSLPRPRWMSPLVCRFCVGGYAVGEATRLVAARGRGWTDWRQCATEWAFFAWR